MAGWLDQVGIRLTQLSTGLKVEAELGNNEKLMKEKENILRKSVDCCQFFRP